jgi:hypothetical protein
VYEILPAHIAMPLTYEIFPTEKVVLATAWGTLTDEHVLDHKRRLAADPLFSKDFVELSDVREVTDLQVTPEGIRSFVDFDRTVEHEEGHRRAVVASEAFTFGMARMYQLSSGSNDASLGVFRTMEEARRWLGLEGPPGSKE